MDIKLFTDLIDALGKVTTGLKTVFNLPRSERDEIRNILADSYRLIDTTLNMLIIRLGDILLVENQNNLLDETMRLDNYEGWLKAEREFRLCMSLRTALRETESFIGKINDAVCIKDCNAMHLMMKEILATEGELATFISMQFNKLAYDALDALKDPQKIQSVRESLTAFREALIKEHLQLINNEIILVSVV